MISDIENGFIDTLEVLKTEGLKTLSSYSEVLRMSDVEDMVRRYPAVYVVWNDLNARVEKDAYQISVSVIVCDKNLRGDSSARMGDGVSLGVYYWLDRCRELLHRQSPVSGCTPARLVKESPLAAEKNVAIYQATYELTRRITMHREPPETVVPEG